MATFTVTSGLSPAFVSGDTVTPAKLNSLGTPTIAISAIQTADISDAQVTADKLATGAVTGAAGGGKIAASAITGQTQLADPLASGDEFLVHDTSASALRRVAFNAMQPAGSVLQTVAASTDQRLSMTTSVAFPLDDNAPTSSMGTQLLTASITPSSSSNKILATVSVPVISPDSSYTHFGTALFRSSTCIQCAVAHRPVSSGSPAYGQSLSVLDEPNTTGAVTYSVRIMPASIGNAVYINGTSTARWFGGSAKATLTLQEIKG